MKRSMIQDKKKNNKMAGVLPGPAEEREAASRFLGTLTAEVVHTSFPHYHIHLPPCKYIKVKIFNLGLEN